MISPFHFRPPQQEDLDQDGKTVDDWEDNALSNSLAWASQTFTPTWCQNPHHWTSRLAASLFTTCPCCMIFRGIVIGCGISVVLWSLMLVIVWLLVR